MTERLHFHFHFVAKLLFLDSVGKASAYNVGDLGSIPGLGRSPGEGNGYPLQENSMDSIVHGVTKSQTQLNDFHFTKCICMCSHAYECI